MSEYNLTVIVPVYNGEKFLKSCLESIAAQTLDNIEVVVIDDGSTDSSADIARSFEEKYSHFKLLRQENGGKSVARNRGLDAAKGKYITFVDADDFIDPLMYERLKKKAVERQAGEVRCGAVQFDDRSGRIIRHRREFAEYTEITSTENLMKAFLGNKIDHMVWNGIYHRSLFEKTRFPVDTEYEDQYVTPEVLAQTNKYVYIPFSYYYYRKHPEAFSRSVSSDADSKVDKVQSLNRLFHIIKNSTLKEELSYFYSRYFYDMILNYHNPIIYQKPGYLRKSHKSIDNLIIPEAFHYVLKHNHLEPRERFFLRIIRRSHFLFFPIQKLTRIWDMFFRVDSLSHESNQKGKMDKTRHNRDHEKLIAMYA